MTVYKYSIFHFQYLPMFSSSRSNSSKSKPYAIRKSGLKEKLIDRQILAVHKAMVEKLITVPELRPNVISIIEERYKNGRLRHGGYLTWICLMENIEDYATFRRGVLEDTPRMNKLRRNTPFVGVLTEEERQQALLQDACGETTIETVF